MTKLDNPKSEILKKIAIFAAIKHHCNKNTKKSTKINSWTYANILENSFGKKINAKSDIYSKLITYLFILFCFSINQASCQEEIVRVNLTKFQANSILSTLVNVEAKCNNKVIAINPKSNIQFILQNNIVYLKVSKNVNFSDLSQKYILGKIGDNVKINLELKPKILSDKPSYEFNNKNYNGFLNFEITQNQNQLKVLCIDNVRLEDYIKDVVPGEMPANWPVEALKAQAILARTYVLANKGKYGNFDVKDNTCDQVFNGECEPNQNIEEACKTTENIVLMYDNKIISSFYHSSSGGFTDISDNVWNKHIPYLKSVDDFDDNSPFSHWQRKFSLKELESTLFNQKSNIIDVNIVATNTAQRAHSIMIITDNKTNNAYLLNAEDLRSKLHLPSSNFTVSNLNGIITFDGRGFGHGLGLSQWGARNMAIQGYTAYDILKYYFKDIVFKDMSLRDAPKTISEVTF